MILSQTKHKQGKMKLARKNEQETQSHEVGTTHVLKRSQSVKIKWARNPYKEGSRVPFLLPNR